MRSPARRASGRASGGHAHVIRAGIRTLARSGPMRPYAYLRKYAILHATATIRKSSRLRIASDPRITCYLTLARIPPPSVYGKRTLPPTTGGRGNNLTKNRKVIARLSGLVVRIRLAKMINTFATNALSGYAIIQRSHRCVIAPFLRQ